MAQELKLVAQDGDDLAVLSATLQDAILRVGDMAFQPKRRRFAAVVNRFCWESVAEVAGATGSDGASRGLYERARTGLHFDGVLAVRSWNIAQEKPDAILSLLAIEFVETTPPGGEVTLHFAGGGALRLTVECIDAVLADLGGRWTTSNRPTHETENDRPA